jgi:hypothetical protein
MMHNKVLEGKFGGAPWAKATSALISQPHQGKEEVLVGL